MVNEKLKLPENDIVKMFVEDKFSRFKISKIYDVDYHVISEIIDKYNLSPEKRKITQLSESDINAIVELYKEGMPPKLIKTKFNIGTERVKSIVRDNGIELNKTGGKRIYNVNENYFERIDTKEKAMFFGLFFADGYNDEKNGVISLGLAEYDLKTVELFAESIGSNHKINLYARSKNGKSHQNVATIVVSSRKLSQDLSKLGCMQRKSLIKKFPRLANSDLIKSFIYGYFLGNGCLHKRIGKKSFVHTFSIASNYDMCLEFKKIFLQINVNSTIRKDKITNYSTIQVAGNLQIKRLMDWLFKDEINIMERKTKKYKELVSYVNEKERKF